MLSIAIGFACGRRGDKRQAAIDKWAGADSRGTETTQEISVIGTILKLQHA
jgi:hypothetical protein